MITYSLKDGLEQMATVETLMEYVYEEMNARLISNLSPDDPNAKRNADQVTTVP